jgi:hypothetical protein
VASMAASAACARRWKSPSDSDVVAGVAELMVDRMLAMKLPTSVATQALWRARRLLVLLACCGLIGACGQKGPLTRASPVASAASAATAR